jgi:hypothetical protein
MPCVRIRSIMYGSRGHGCTTISSMHRSRARSSAARLAQDQAQASFNSFSTYPAHSVLDRVADANADANKRTGRSVNDGSARIVVIGAYSLREARGGPLNLV